MTRTMAEFAYETRRLTAVITGPILWAVHFVFVYVAVSLACAGGLDSPAVAGMPWVNLILIGFSLLILGVMAVRSLRLLRGLRRLTEETEDEEDRGELFRGALALLLYLLSFVAVVWVSLPLFVIAPCL